MANYSKQGQHGMTPEQDNAMREQQVINARIVSLDKVLQLYGSGPYTVEQLIGDAEKVTAFLIGDVQALKPKSGIIQQANMPPEGMFSPGR